MDKAEEILKTYISRKLSDAMEDFYQLHLKLVSHLSQFILLRSMDALNDENFVEEFKREVLKNISKEDTKC